MTFTVCFVSVLEVEQKEQYCRPTESCCTMLVPQVLMGRWLLLVAMFSCSQVGCHSRSSSPTRSGFSFMARSES